jgi:arabinan endo-1,5-alpha-L-arabinosidase
MVAWVKPAAHNFYGRILELGNGKGLDNISFGQYAGTNQLAFEVRPAGSAVLRVLAPAGTFSVGTWNQVAVTEAPGGLTTFYVNGAAVASSTYARFPANTSRAVNFLARSAWTGEPAYRGTLDDVAIWNRALSDTEIAGLNSAGS